MPEALRSPLDPPERNAKLIAIPQEKVKREEAEEPKNQVEQTRPGVSEVDSVNGEQVGREKRESSVAEQASDRQKQHEDAQRSHERHGYAPAPRVVRTEGPLSERDRPFADGRMHHVLGVGKIGVDVAALERSLRDVLRPRALVALAKERIGVAHVIDLIEDEGLDVAELIEAQSPRPYDKDEREDPRRGALGKSEWPAGFLR